MNESLILNVWSQENLNWNGKEGEDGHHNFWIVYLVVVGFNGAPQEDTFVD